MPQISRCALEKKSQGDLQLGMHKRYDKDFKAKVALEAIRGEKTIQEIAAAYSTPSEPVSQWKKQLLESAGKLFEKKGRTRQRKRPNGRKIELFKQIGQLQVENEFLKKYRQLYGASQSCRARSSCAFDLAAMRTPRDFEDGVLLRAAGSGRRSRPRAPSGDSGGA